MLYKLFDPFLCLLSVTTIGCNIKYSIYLILQPIVVHKRYIIVSLIILSAYITD